MCGYVRYYEGHDSMNTDNPDALAEENIAQRVREELARRRISRQALADMAKISISTLEKALGGNRSFTLATVIRLEEALGTSLRGADSQELSSRSGTQTAPMDLGSYTRTAVNWIEAEYLTIRPSFSGDDAMYTYLSTIMWDENKAHLVFFESQRVDAEYQQRGAVSMPHLSGHIYCITNEEGQIRSMVLGRPNIGGCMIGILTTLQVGHGSQLVPTACPVALKRLDSCKDAVFGLIKSGAPQHDAYRSLIDAGMKDDYMRFRL